MGQLNIVVLGLDDTNRELLRRVPDADRYEFHGLMSIAELQQGEDIPIDGAAAAAESRIEAFDGRCDAIVGFCDFPVSTMVPLLCRRFGLPGRAWSRCCKCEHKYWSRLVQREVIDEYPPFALVDLDEPRLPAEVGYPCWLKPVKSFSSELAFEVTDDAGVRRRRSPRSGRASAGWGSRSSTCSTQADLPPEIAEAGGQAALAERALSGDRAAVEGYCPRRQVVVYGVLDSLIYPDVVELPAPPVPVAAARRDARRGWRTCRGG